MNNILTIQCLDRVERASSLPPAQEYYANTYFAGRVTARPFNERALSMPRQVSYSYDTRCVVTPPRETQVDTHTHYSDFDYKVINYMGKYKCVLVLKDLREVPEPESSSKKVSVDCG